MMRGRLPLQPVTGPQPEGCPSSALGQSLGHLPHKGEGFFILIYRPNTDPKLLNQFEMFCT